MTSTCRPSASKNPFSRAITIGAQSVSLMNPNFNSSFSRLSSVFFLLVTDSVASVPPAGVSVVAAATSDPSSAGMSSEISASPLEHPKENAHRRTSNPPYRNRCTPCHLDSVATPNESPGCGLFPQHQLIILPSIVCSNFHGKVEIHSQNSSLPAQEIHD